MSADRLGFLHIHVLDALYREGAATALGLVFQGGTALHLGYGSPRRSEDLDLLVRRSEATAEALNTLMNRAHDRVRQAALLQYGSDDLQLKVNARNPRGHNPAVFEFRLTGATPAEPHAVLKVEFFAVEPEVLNRYGRGPRSLRSPLYPHLSPVAPVASLQEILLDKIHALGGRRYLKYRDVFDLWWLQQSAGLPLTPEAFANFPTHRAMYTDASEPSALAAAAVGRLATANPADMRRELVRFLPEGLLDDTSLAAMIEAARTACAAFAHAMTPPPAARRKPR